MIDIARAEFPRDVAEVRRLFRAYADGIGIDLGFQGFEEELASLPGKYGPPAGCVLLAHAAGAAVGCVALRPIDAATCEMKRLYVDPRMRGTGLGRQLALRICAEGHAAGYRRMCLDTLPTMPAAVALYRDLGFEPTAPYVYNPIPGALFLAFDLTRGPGQSRHADD